MLVALNNNMSSISPGLPTGNGLDPILFGAESPEGFCQIVQINDQSLAYPETTIEIHYINQSDDNNGEIIEPQDLNYQNLLHIDTNLFNFDTQHVSHEETVQTERFIKNSYKKQKPPKIKIKDKNVLNGFVTFEERNKGKVVPVDDDKTEPDLTNLTWLQNITNIMSVPSLPTPPVSPRCSSPPNSRSQKLNQSITKCYEEFLKNSSVFQTDGSKKPPFSYATMICMAMRDNGNKMTLSEIYAWIRDNFMYYRRADPSWHNSIRHNLSLNKVFVKIARSKDEPGKGGFWRMDLDRLQEARRCKRRSRETMDTPRKPKRKKSKPQEVKNTTQPVMSHPDQIIATEVNVLTQDNNEICEDFMMDQEIILPENDITLELEQSFDSEQIELSDQFETMLPEEHIIADNGNVIVETVDSDIPSSSISNQGILGEDELAGLLLASVGWDDSQLELLDSLLDSL